MGVKTVVKRIAGKAGDKVAQLSKLSPMQIEEVEANREQYLLEMPDPKDEVAREITDKMLAASSVEIFNAYLSQLKTLYLPMIEKAEYEVDFDTDYNIRYFNITKWVTDKKENNLEKLVNVYAVLSDEDCNIALVFNRTKKGTDVYLAVVNLKNEKGSIDAKNFCDRLKGAIVGNFPGAEISNESEGILPCMKNDKPYSVAVTSNIPTEKSEKFVSQTIEKLLDGIVPDSSRNEYIIVLLATPIQDIEERKLKLSEFYSGLKPYAEWQQDFHFSDSVAHGSNATVGVNIGASAGVQNGQSSGQTISDGESENNSSMESQNQSKSNADSRARAESESNSHMDGTSENKTQTQSEGNSIGANAGVTVGKPDSFGGYIGLSGNHTWGESNSETFGKSASDTLTKGLTNTISSTVTKTTGTSVANTLGRAVTRSIAKTASDFGSHNFGVNFGSNFARASTVTASIGKNEGITQSFTNYNIKHALELLENQMKRLEQSSALGMWDFAAYVLSEDLNVANNVAHTYLALTLGENSYMSQSAINLWRGNVEDEKETAREICSYIRKLRHPIFALNMNICKQRPDFLVYPPVVTAATSLSGKELAYSLNFPSKAISGLPILECTSFGRNVVTFDERNSDDKEYNLGRIFHMYHEENNEVKLSQQSFASHVFVTGSTGSGKSNTVYQLINQARKSGTNFLVVEPAKGEYKTVFGMKKDVYVYGTNPTLTPLLRINPFSFPKGIHILEHLDRLVEIFNVCWPMYAAMPAVLKSAVEKSYSDCGWNLKKSENKYGENIFPTFADVAKNVKIIIDSSEYDTDNKGAYKGSLLTRLESLTNGINGMIFVQDEIKAEDLFDKNVIVDLSRVGSSETKSLIMGMIVLKLQEYRMTSAEGINQPLQHITVLEEAHNILKRTSAEQTSEGGNLLGKSVEMLSNAIAEMRTYGEGFIIVDQSPGLLDMSAIRNTNTKIIMRLPDFSDRELVGKSANLNDDQIKELAKLPCGVGAVYQNEWIQPVLCKIRKYQGGENLYTYNPQVDIYGEEQQENTNKSLLDEIMNKEIFRKDNKENLKDLKEKIIKSSLETDVKCEFMEYFNSDTENALEKLQKLVFDFLNAAKAVELSENCTNITEWVHSVVRELNPSVKGYSKEQIDLVIALVILEQSQRDTAYSKLLDSFTEIYREKGGVY